MLYDYKEILIYNVVRLLAIRNKYSKTLPCAIRFVEIGLHCVGTVKGKENTAAEPLSSFNKSWNEKESRRTTHMFNLLIFAPIVVVQANRYLYSRTAD